MGETVSTKVVLDASSFNSEARAMAQSIKSVGKEMKSTDAALQQSGTKVQQLENKYKGLQKQLEMQTQLSKKYDSAVKKSSTAQAQASKKLEAANKLYANSKQFYGENSKQAEKWAKVVNKSEKALNSATTAHEKYKGQLADSRTAEAKFAQQISSTGAALKNQKKYTTQVNEEFTRLQNKTEGVRNGMTKTGRALTVGVTVPLVAAGAKVVKVSQEFNKAVANIGTLGVDGNRLQELKGGIQDVAIEVAKDTSDIADGAYQIVSAWRYCRYPGDDKDQRKGGSGRDVHHDRRDQPDQRSHQGVWRGKRGGDTESGRSCF